jgi:DNA-binding response OmpR family regulator
MLDHTHSSRESTKYPNLRGKRILVVEDDPVIAVDYYFQLREVGARPGAYEPTNKAALDYLAAHEVDAAIVDYRLRDGPCEPVLQFLQSRHIPFIVVSGCTFEMHVSVSSTSQVLSKPVEPTQVWRALSEVLH